MKQSAEAKLEEDITAIERSSRIRIMSVVMVILLIAGFVALYRPDLPKDVFDNTVEGFRNLTSRIPEPKEEQPAEEEAVVEEAKEEEPEPKPGTVLELSSVVSYKGRNVVLTFVNSKETYCMIRVNDESVLGTKGTERNINGVIIKVLEPSTAPSETCRVMMR